MIPGPSSPRSRTQTQRGVLAQSERAPRQDGGGDGALGGVPHGTYLGAQVESGNWTWQGGESGIRALSRRPSSRSVWRRLGRRGRASRRNRQHCRRRQARGLERNMDTSTSAAPPPQPSTPSSGTAPAPSPVPPRRPVPSGLVEPRPTPPPSSSAPSGLVAPSRPPGGIPSARVHGVTPPARRRAAQPSTTLSPPRPPPARPPSWSPPPAGSQEPPTMPPLSSVSDRPSIPSPPPPFTSPVASVVPPPPAPSQRQRRRVRPPGEPLFRSPRRVETPVVPHRVAQSGCLPRPRRPGRPTLAARVIVAAPRDNPKQLSATIVVGRIRRT